MAYQLNHIDNRLHTIQRDTAQGVDDIQTYAKSRATTETADRYENALMSRTSNLKKNISGQLDDLHKDVTNRRPSPNDTNYTHKIEQYRKFLVHATDGIESMKNVFSRLFSKLFEVVKKIVKWVGDHLPEIVSAITTIFSHVIVPLLNYSQ
jgi:hypothetical protein